MPLTPKQDEYLEALLTRQYKFLMYGGGVAGGKTILSLGILDELCMHYPGIRFAVVRKSLSTIRRNTVPSFYKVLEMNGDFNRAKLNKTEWAIIYKNGSRIDLVEANVATDPTFNKLRGLEVTAALIEEANEVVQEAFETLKTRIGRWKNDVFDIPPFILLTTNPDLNWVKDMFYDPYVAGTLKKGYFFLQALPHDNPYNTKEYFETLEDLPEAEHQRYVKGNWDYADDPNQLIKFIWLKSQLVDEIPDYRLPKFIGIDVAREGDDSTIFCLGDDLGTIRYEEFKGLKSYEIADLIEERMEWYDIPADNIAVDGIGIGAGVVDSCEERGIYIATFKSSEKPVEGVFLPILRHFSFFNRRTQAHWLLREDIKDGRLECINHTEFKKQTLQIRYFVKEKYIRIESKEELKKRLKGSPDHEEATVIFNFVRRGLISGTPFNVNIDEFEEDREDYIPMVKRMDY